MLARQNIFGRIWRFYRDGFRNMTWGRPLVWLILLKLFILFAVLRVFFFKPAMAGLSDEQKSEQVGERLTKTNNTNTLNLLTD
ncbi:MAG: DUF4492 domain-containing protein [Bacteroidales bacterium]|nr:DUF4492 domain-containing protein [Bacteroidales bacterium]